MLRDTAPLTTRVLEMKFPPVPNVQQIMQRGQ